MGCCVRALCALGFSLAVLSSSSSSPNAELLPLPLHNPQCREASPSHSFFPGLFLACLSFSVSPSLTRVVAPAHCAGIRSFYEPIPTDSSLPTSRSTVSLPHLHFQPSLPCCRPPSSQFYRAGCSTPHSGFPTSVDFPELLWDL